MRTDRHFLHQKIVAHARTHGIKAAARELGASRNTIRKWLRRYIPGKPSSLVEISRAPKSCPHKTPPGLEGQIVKLRKQTGFGAERLVHEFDLKISHNAVARIIRAHGLTRPRKKKPATKKQLRSVKREWKLFGQITADTKYLNDIPNYWPQMMRHRLPRFQYTAREVVSGACFTGYADELSKSYAVLLAEQLSAHLALHGVDLSQLVWQTDNGGEFQENKLERGLPSTVRLLGSDHRFIPPKRYTWQSDVETVHRLVEDEFLDREAFRSPAEFFAKANTYWSYFNLVRKNRGKEWQSPFQILSSRAPAIAGALLDWQPLNLSRRHHAYLPKGYTGGHDVPRYPLSCGEVDRRRPLRRTLSAREAYEKWPPIRPGVCNGLLGLSVEECSAKMPTRLLSITPRIVGDVNGITATTARVAQFLMLGARFRQVRVDRMERTVTIEDRSWWVRRRSRVILFDEVAAVGYGYEEWSLSGGIWARDPIDRFVVGLKLKWGEETRLFWFVGDGTFTNDGPFPDWYYWKEIAFDLQGTQEQESRMFARVLGNLLGAPLGPSTLTAE